jgi:carbonic anhydrase
MNRRHALRALVGFALCPFCVSRGFAADGPHWSYEGATGPTGWGTLDPASGACGIGGQQSPVDIRTTVKAQLSPLKVSWAKQADTIVNNGHTIQINFAPGGSSGLTVGKDKYALQQFHFHRPSEHLINGKDFPMEAHFVHSNDAGSLAVIGVMMMTGTPNATFGKIVSTMPKDEGPPVKADGAIDANRLLPGKRSYYSYEGSLTTPPCSEVVNWFLLTDPIHVADADVAAFAKLYPMNARPAQKVNRRFVLRSG